MKTSYLLTNAQNVDEVVKIILFGTSCNLTANELAGQYAAECIEDVIDDEDEIDRSIDAHLECLLEYIDAYKKENKDLFEKRKHEARKLNLAEAHAHAYKLYTYIIKG